MLTWQSPVEQAQSAYLTSLTDPFTILLIFPIQTLIVSEIQSSLPSSGAIIGFMRSGSFQLEREQSEMPSREEEQNDERKSHSLEQWMEYKKKQRAKMVKGRRGGARHGAAVLMTCPAEFKTNMRNILLFMAQDSGSALEVLQPHCGALESG